MITVRKQLNRQKVVLFFCMVGVVSAFFGAVYQAYRYEELSLKITALENTQMDKIEQNKRAIASIAVLSAPARIDALAQQQKDLVKGYPANAIIINPPPGHRTEGSASQQSKAVPGARR